jgi:hypothetical protein
MHDRMPLSRELAGQMHGKGVTGIIVDEDFHVLVAAVSLPIPGGNDRRAARAIARRVVKVKPRTKA